MRWLCQVPKMVLRYSVTPMTTQTLTRAVRSFSATVKLPPDIDYEELKQKLKEKEVTLVDVRLPKELVEEGQIPDSRNIGLQWLGQAILLPDEEFTTLMGFRKPALDDPIVVSCLGGVRARTAQLAMQGAGYTNVRVYVGSFEDWIERGGALVFPAEEV